MIIDSHIHLWKYSEYQYPWITRELSVLKKDFLLDSLQPTLEKNNINNAIVVQATQTLEETLWLLGLTQTSTDLVGVVGWIDLQNKYLEEALHILSGYKTLLGFRHLIQDEPNEDFILNNNFISGVKTLAKHNYVYEILVRPSHLANTLKFVEQIPTGKLVLDHAGKPNLKDTSLLTWKQYISELSKFPNLYCKVSGLITEANWQSWNNSDIYPALDHLFSTFGEDRLIFGSDWPVCLLSGSYQDTINLVKDYIGRKHLTEQKVFGLNAKKFYGI